MKPTSSLLSICALLLVACQSTSTGTSSTSQGAMMANPASVNCTQKGGTLTIKSNAKGGQYGVCTFEDNRQCEEWAFMRGQCPAGGMKITGYEKESETYCVITGGEIQGLGTTQESCKRTDGTMCAIDANFNGECPDPNNPEPNAGNSEAQ